MMVHPGGPRKAGDKGPHRKEGSSFGLDRDSGFAIEKVGDLCGYLRPSRSSCPHATGLDSASVEDCRRPFLRQLRLALCKGVVWSHFVSCDALRSWG